MFFLLLFLVCSHCESKGGVCTVLMILVAFANVAFGCFCLYALGREACRRKAGGKKKDQGYQYRCRRCCRRCRRRRKFHGVPGGLFHTGATHANPLFGQPTLRSGADGAAVNPMYRSKRTSSLSSTLASRSDGVEMMCVTSTLKGGASRIEKTLLEEVKRLKKREAKLMAENKALKRRPRGNS